MGTLHESPVARGTCDKIRTGKSDAPATSMNAFFLPVIGVRRLFGTIKEKLVRQEMRGACVVAGSVGRDGAGRFTSGETTDFGGCSGAGVSACVCICRKHAANNVVTPPSFEFNHAVPRVFRRTAGPGLMRKPGKGE